MQLETKRYLQHIYTRTTKTPITDILTGETNTDEWNQPVYLTEVVTPNLPCFYQVVNRTIVTPYGVTVQNVPVLSVPTDDPLAEADIVTNIQTSADPRTGAQVMLLAGPVAVEQMSLMAPEFGGSIFKQVTLRQVQVVSNSV